MGKGMEPKKGYNDKKYKENYDDINWSSVRKNKCGCGKTQDPNGYCDGSHNSKKV
jgi:CDGSH-type Zn-finger protein